MGTPQAFPTRRTFAVLALAFVAFAVYGSLLPFQFSPVPLAQGWNRFRGAILVLPPHISRSDFLANILLFVPIGFSMAGAMLLDRQRLLRATLACAAILPACVFISASIEFAQVFTGDRVPAVTDIAAQLIGAGFGLTAWMISGTRLTHWLRSTFASTRQDRLIRALMAYAALWVLFHLAPFDFTVDLGDLAARFRTGQISPIPFAGGDFLRPDRLTDAAGELLSAIPLGILAVSGRTRGRRPSSLALLLGIALVGAIEFVQVFIASHAATGTDLFFSTCGVAIGVSVAGRASRLEAPDVRPADSRFDRKSAVFVALWIVLLLAFHWAPYDFTLDTDAIRRKLADLSFMPFAGYRQGAYLNALSTLLSKLALSIPLGTAAVFAIPQRHRNHRIAVLSCLVTAAGLFACIETGQLFLPSRVPDVTDVMVGVTGVYAGICLGRWLPGGQADDTFRTREKGTY